MSRIGKKAVSVPGNVKVAVADGSVKVDGPKGSLTINVRPEVNVEWDEKAREVRCAIDDAENRAARAYWGMTRALIQNMVVGVTQGYEKTMEIVGVGWQAQLAGKQLKMQLGFASPVMMDIPPGITVSVEKQIVKINGPDKQAVGQFAAAMRAKRKPEPYNGKGVKYASEVIRRKQGKQFGS
ncbi:MAG TPA: 50S ribosomal protein L6 [Phycisphaerales bacterium]|nr:50S ribosomal protein L6 [Phycisphaerales bacterium]